MIVYACDNEYSHAEAYKDVINEDAMKSRWIDQGPGLLLSYRLARV
jgi:hypothetical protein